MKKLNNINAIWGQVEQPKTSNDKITYHGDYHAFEDIDTSQFTDEALVWHRPEFPKEEWRYGLYGINNNEDNNYVEEEGVMTIELQKKYLIVRILGNDLETLHGKNQTYDNLKFTIKNESSFINTDKLYILNRIADKEYKQQIITLLEATKQKYIDQPFEIEKFNKLPEINMSYEEFKQKNPEHPKSLIYYSSILKEHNLYLINNNGCRNFGLKYGKRNGYKWTFVLDSNSYFTDEYYNNIIKYISKNTHYIVIPQIRIDDYNLENNDILNSNNLNRKFEMEEPQLAFHINSKYKFNELIPYGLSPKAEFLNAIQSKGKWNNWKDNELINIKSRKFEDVKIQTLSNNIRLNSYNKYNSIDNNWIRRWTGLFLLIQKIKFKKVICIGMYKTGTTSMNKALEILNYKSANIFNSTTTICNNRNVGITLKDSLLLTDYEIEQKIKKHNNWRVIEETIKITNNFGDGPWLHIYREFYKVEPNSKFILTLRNSEEVAKSDIAMWIRIHKVIEPINYFEFSDGVANSYEELKTILINRYLKHVEDVRDFFKDKQEQLLELDIFQEDNPWIKLCEFLNCAIPTCDFPHLNRKL
jgi:hypothetical protein